MTTWFITGISRGLGRELAAAAVRRGDTVIGTQRMATEQTVGPDDRLTVLSLDLAERTDLDEMVGAVVRRHGRIDVVVNNAGYGLLGPAEAASDAEVERLFEVNTFAPFRLIRAFLPYLRVQGSGHIVNVTSIAGRAPMASSALYAAAKAAVEGLTHALAQEVAPFGIRVTAVAPGAMRTDFLTDHSLRRSDGGLVGTYAASVGRALDHFQEIAGRQAGDPQRAALAIIETVMSADPPVHLLLGSDALRRARERIAAEVADIERWETVTRSADVVEQSDV